MTLRSTANSPTGAFHGSGDRGAGSAAAFPAENRENHYYAARQTASTPVLVKTPRGEQQEKFLFIAGGEFAVPLAVRLMSGGQC